MLNLSLIQKLKASACRPDCFQRSASMVRVEKGLLYPPLFTYNVEF